MQERLELERVRMLTEERVAKYSGSNVYYTSGTIIKPALSYNSLTRELTVGEGMYRAFLTTNFTGEIKEFIIPQTVLTLLDNTRYYIVAKYNNGNPIVYAETDPLEANDSNAIAVYTIFTEGNELDALDWGTEGVSLANKLNERLIDTNRYGIVYGFGLSANTLIITISGGQFYLGSNKIDYNEINSTTNECELLYKNGLGGWSEQDILTYPNTKYDDGSGTLATLTDTHYGIAWVWKSAGNPNEMYVILGDQSYATIDLAKNGKTPSDIPDKVSLGSFLVGRIIFQKGSTSAVTESAFDTVFNANAPTLHNALLNLQGSGVAGEYYHLNNAQYTVVQNTSGTNTGDETQATIKSKLGVANTSQDGYLTSTDWDTFNEKEPALAKGNLTAGSNKVSIGSGTNAVIGAGVSVDVNPSNILHNDLSTKQGGNGTNEYFHLTNAELANFNKLATVVNNQSKAVISQSTVNNNTITSTNTYQKLTLTLNGDFLANGFSLDAVNSRLVYAGNTKFFFFNGTATLSGASTNNTIINFRVYKTNNGLINTTSSVKLDSSTSASTINAASGFLMNNGDYIEIWASADKTLTFTISNIQLQLIEDIGYSYDN